MAKILVVDDDATFRETVQALLIEDGHEPALAENGVEAVQTFNNVAPDVVIIDMLMPKMSGFDCADALRGTPLGQDIPIIFVSGAYRSPKTVSEAQDRFKAFAYLVKPFNAAELTSTINNALGQGGAAEAADVDVDAVPVPESGTLIEVSVARLLLHIQRDRHTGILELYGDKSRARMFFYRGNAVQAQTLNPELNVGMVLLRSGQLSPYDYKALLEHVESEAVGLYKALQDFKTIADTTIKEAYRRLVPEIVASCVAMTGHFRWIATDAFMRLIPTASVGVLPSIYEGMKQAPADLLEAHLEPIKTLRMSKGGNWQAGKRHLEEGVGLSDVLKSVNGRTRIAQIYGAASDPEIKRRKMAQIFMLVSSDAVQLSEEVVEVEPSAVTPVVEVQLGDQQVEVDEAKFENLHAAAGAAAPSTHMADAFEYDPEADERADGAIQFTPDEIAARERIIAKFREIRELDYYSVLGVGKDPFDAARAKASYFQLARDFHSDSYSGLNLGSAKNKLEAVFAKISEAYDTVSNEEKRGEYNAQLDLAAKGITADVATIFQAEGLFDKAQILADRGDFTSALRNLDEALALYPSDQIEVWHIYCGFRARGNQPPEAHSALLRINEILKKAKVERAWEFLGIICRFSDDIKKAKLYFRRAIEEEGTTPSVERELRLIAKRAQQPQKKGLFGR